MANRNHHFSDRDSWRGLDHSFRNLIDRFFYDSPAGWRQHDTFTTPMVDIVETVDDYHVHAELQGVSKHDLIVELENGLLTLRGEKKCQRDEKNERGHRYECSYGSFSRSFSLPQDAQAKQVQIHG